MSDRWGQDDYFNGWHNIIRGTNNDEVIRRVENYKGSTSTVGELTLAGSPLSAESGAQTCEVSRFHPDDVKRVFNRIRQNVFPQIGIVRDIETIVTGPLQVLYTVPSTMRRIIRMELGQRYEAGSLSENLFLNADFEDWTNATTLPNWTIAGSGADVAGISVNQEEDTSPSPNYAVLSEANSARIVVPSTTVTTLLQTVDSASSDYPAIAMEGMETNVSGWVYCNTASRVSIRIAGADGTAHGGTGWEFIKSSANLAATATSVAAGFVGSSGSAIPFFIDEAICVVGPSEVLEHPYAPIHNWEFVPPAGGAATGGSIRVKEHLPSKHRIRIVGVDILSSVSADSDTVEIDGELLEPVYNKCRAELCNERYEQTNDSRWREKRDDYELAYQDAIQHVGLKLPARKFRIPDLVN